MYFRPIWIGCFAAVLIVLPRLLWKFFPSIEWQAPIYIFAVVVAILIVREILIDRATHLRSRLPDVGLSDLQAYIYQPPSGKQVQKNIDQWNLRGLSSFLFSLFGGSVGAEGAAIEWTHSLATTRQKRSARWFEQLRRTDVSCVLAAVVSGVFSSPLAGLVFPVELRTGGGLLMAAVSGVTSFLLVRVFETIFGLQNFGLILNGVFPVSQFSDSFWWNWNQLLTLVFILLFVMVFNIMIVASISYFRKSNLLLFRGRMWLSLLVGGSLLFLLIKIFPLGHLPAPFLFDEVFKSPHSTASLAFLLVSEVMVLVIVTSIFATTGILWPTFLIGGILGVLVCRFTLGHEGLSMVMGGSTLLGVFLGAPITAAIVAFSLSGSYQVFLVALVLGGSAAVLRKIFKVRSFIDEGLKSRGIELDRGRSIETLGKLKVEDAMVKDFELVYEHENISNLKEKMDKSIYPFFPVVTAQGVFKGLLTTDMIEESLLDLKEAELEKRVSENQSSSRDEESSKVQEHQSLSTFLEAKDLLYRYRAYMHGVRQGDRLSNSSNLFDQTPVVPVLDLTGRVLGLLFAYKVRIAYEQEVASQALSGRKLEKPPSENTTSEKVTENG